jgi:hypothetical protein
MPSMRPKALASGRRSSARDGLLVGDVHGVVFDGRAGGAEVREVGRISRWSSTVCTRRWISAGRQLQGTGTHLRDEVLRSAGRHPASSRQFGGLGSGTAAARQHQGVARPRQLAQHFGRDAARTPGGQHDQIVQRGFAPGIGGHVLGQRA